MHHKNFVFAAACLGMLLFGIVFLSLGSVNNMLTERFGLDDRAIGTLTALLPLGILLGSLVFGPIADRFGYRWLLIAAALLVGGALEGLAFAETPSLVQVCVFAIGFGGGILNGATNALAADVSEGERAAKLSLLGVFFGIGALTMPSSLATLSNHFALHSIVAGIGALALLPAIYCLLIAFPPAKQRSERVAMRQAVRMLGEPFLLIACLALALQSGMEGMSNDWTTRYIKSAIFKGHIDESKVQLSLVALTGAMMVTRLLLAVTLKHVSSRVVLLASLCSTAFGCLVLANAKPESATFAILGPALIGAGLAAIFPVVLGYVGDRYPQQSGTAFSTIFVIALTGNMLINKTFGHIAHEYGVQRYPEALLAVLLAAAVLLHFLNNLRHPTTLDNNT
ncbi:MAG TPA: MFS transporter [Lacipirellulaceae bacterium]|jgi:MFS family permease|nr:MFS transporter [Lacipirellulaceae bacterium]